MLARCTKLEPPCSTDTHREWVQVDPSRAEQVEWAEAPERPGNTVGGPSAADVNVRN